MCFPNCTDDSNELSQVEQVRLSCVLQIQNYYFYSNSQNIENEYALTESNQYVDRIYALGLLLNSQMLDNFHPIYTIRLRQLYDNHLYDKSNVVD